MFRPAKVFRQYGFIKISDYDFLQKTLILGILFFGTPGTTSPTFNQSEADKLSHTNSMTNRESIYCKALLYEQRLQKSNTTYYFMEGTVQNFPDFFKKVFTNVHTANRKLGSVSYSTYSM